MENVKLNFDTSQPDKETISPDKNCSICYGKGKMQLSGNLRFTEKECVCITRKRVHKSRVEHSAIYRDA